MLRFCNRLYVANKNSSSTNKKINRKRVKYEKNTENLIGDEIIGKEKPDEKTRAEQGGTPFSLNRANAYVNRFAGSVGKYTGVRIT